MVEKFALIPVEKGNTMTLSVARGNIVTLPVEDNITCLLTIPEAQR